MKRKYQKPQDPCLGVIPNVPMGQIQEAPKYEPGRVEEAILKYLTSSYNSELGQMDQFYYRVRLARAMAFGQYRRNPYDTHPLANIYIPFVAINHRVLTNIHMMRLIPDPQTMDHLNVTVEDDYPDEFKLQYAVENSSPEYQMPIEDVASDIAKRFTVLLRQAMRRSNYMEMRPIAQVFRYRYGFALVIPERKMSRLPEYEPGATLTPEDYEALGLDAAVFEALLEDDDKKYPLYSQGVELTLVDPLNIVVPDLSNSKGIMKLPYFWIRGKRSWREVLEYALSKDESGPYKGYYANTECLTPGQQIDVPSAREDDTAALGFTSGRPAITEETAQQADLSRGYEVPMRIGQFHIEHIADLVDKWPSKAEWREFTDKFGITYEDLTDPTKRDWIIEYVERGGTQVLLRFQPWDLPGDPQSQDIAVEARNWIREGRTLACGDYQMGAGHMEILANNAIESGFKMGQRIADPMFEFDQNSVDQRWLQMQGGAFRYRPGAMIPIVRQPIGGRVLQAVSPPSEAPDMSGKLLGQCHDMMERITGIAPQMTGGGGNTESATEAVQQTNYLEQQVNADLISVENSLDLPIYRRALAIALADVRAQGGVQVVATGEDLKLWNDKYAGVDRVAMTITPEMVAKRFGVEVRTATSLGDRETRLTRMERAVKMLVDLYQYLQLEGQLPMFSKLMTEYLEELGLPNLFQNLSPDEIALKMQMMAQQQAAATVGPTGGSDGGAGQSRPEYPDQRAAEISAPNEPLPGRPPMASQTPGVAAGIV